MLINFEMIDYAVGILFLLCSVSASNAPEEVREDVLHLAHRDTGHLVQDTYIWYILIRHTLVSFSFSMYPFYLHVC